MIRTISKILLVAMVGLAIFARFEQYEVERNYTVYAYAACDPSVQQCFVALCDAEGSECDDTPYAKVEMAAYEAPSCVLDGYCEELICEGAETCTITECTSDTLEEGERCGGESTVSDIEQ